MAKCKGCGFNLGGYCSVFDAGIPREREATEHDCPEWREQIFEGSEEVIEYLDGMMFRHKNSQALIWTLRDMVSGESTPPASWTAAAWRFLWTWQFFNDQERTEIASWIIPF